MATLNLILAIIGTVGLTAAVNGLLLTRRITAAHRYFRMTRKEPLDIILVTSGLEEGGIEGMPYKRPVTSFGTLQGAAMFAKMLGNLRIRKPLSVSVSEQLLGAPTSDVVLLGDATKNPMAEEFLRYFNAAHPTIRIDRPKTDVRARQLRIGDYVTEYTLEFQKTSENPLTDIGLIIAWVSPFAIKKRRAIFCAGFTGWGTAAASDYYLNGLFTERYRKLRKAGELPRFASKKWPCFVCAVEVTLSGHTVVSTNEIYFRRVSDELPTELVRGRTRAQLAANQVKQPHLASATGGFTEPAVDGRIELTAGGNSAPASQIGPSAGS